MASLWAKKRKGSPEEEEEVKRMRSRMRARWETR